LLAFSVLQGDINELYLQLHKNGCLRRETSIFLSAGAYEENLIGYNLAKKEDMAV